MPAPIPHASATLIARLGELLAGCDFLPGADRLEVDPASTVETSGVASEILTAAQVFSGATQTVRVLMGGGSPNYVLEREFRLELAVASPDTAWRDQTLTAALTGCAGLPEARPTLDGACERLELRGGEPDDLPPNGVKFLLTYVVRVRSSDPLGLTE